MPDDNDEEITTIKDLLEEKDPRKKAGFFFGTSLIGMFAIGVEVIWLLVALIMHERWFRSTMTFILLVTTVATTIYAMKLFDKNNNILISGSNKLSPEEIAKKIKEVDKSAEGEPYLQVHKTDLEKALGLKYYQLEKESR